jgi:hypothetical protein
MDGLSGAVQRPGPDPCNGKHGFQGGETVLHQVRSLEEDFFPCVGRRCPYEAASFGKVLPRRFAFFREDLISFLPDWRNK